MKSKSFIGIDNGVSGSIGILRGSEVVYIPMPIVNQLSYTKKKQKINRINISKLTGLLYGYKKDVFVLVERPMVNPTRFKASVSAIRALEATLIAIEMVNVPYSYIDSKEWQKALLPQGLKGIALKHASKEIGIRLFPQCKAQIEKQKDADGLLIAEYCRQTR